MNSFNNTFAMHQIHRSFSLFTMIMFAVASMAQTVQLTFNGQYNSATATLDSVLIMNLDQGTDTTIYYPNNVLLLQLTTGLGEADVRMIPLLNRPNPFQERTWVDLELPIGGSLDLKVHDMLGKEVAAYSGEHAAGVLGFNFEAADEGMYLFSARMGEWKGVIRMVCTGGSGQSVPSLTFGGHHGTPALRSGRSIWQWQPGDQLRYIGYVTTPSAYLASGVIEDDPTSSQTYTFIAANGAACPESPFVTDVDGNVYSTVEVGGRCWFAENLRTSKYQNNDAIPHVPGAVEWPSQSAGAWCNVNNDPSIDALYGKMYNHFVVIDPRNVCPEGWHVPSDADFMEMEAGLGVPPDQLAITGYRGVAVSAGGKAKSVSPLWVPPNAGATGESGLNALPAGNRGGSNGYFSSVGTMMYWWSTNTMTDGTMGQVRALAAHTAGIGRYPIHMYNGCYVRCVKDQ